MNPLLQKWLNYSHPARSGEAEKETILLLSTGSNNSMTRSCNIPLRLTSYPACRSIRGSHTFSREPDFSENEKVGREKRSQWGVPAHGGCVTPRFAVVSMENENWRMGLP